MCTVSPAWKSVRSNTVWAIAGSARYDVGTRNRNGSIPSCHSEKTNVRSSPLRA
jgi:hypothetical protein